MLITIDISLYPLKEDFKTIIKSFIAKFDGDPNLKILKNNISTQICGEYDYLFDLLKQELRPVFEAQPSVFVLKFLKGDKVSE